MKFPRNSKGFTLVEVIIVSVLCSVGGALFLTFMRMHNQAVNEGAARSIIQMQSDIVSADIARKIRGAHQVLAADETFSASQALALRDVGEIVLYGSTGLVAGAYRIEGGVLKESADAATFAPFLSGGNPVNMAAGSAFRLSGNRREVTLYLKVALQYRNTGYESPVKGDMYLCRN